MSTLSLRKIKHDSSSVDNITLDSNGQVGILATPTAPLTIGRVTSVNEGGQIDFCRSTDNASAWGIDVYGNTSTPALRIIDNTATVVRMQIDGSGRVTLPYQPFFYAKNASEAGDGITTNPAVFTNVIRNVGGHFATSGTGAYSRFTAPISGSYFFSGNPGYKQSSVDFAVRLRINGTDVTDLVRMIGSPSSHSGCSFTAIVYLSANDYVDINMAGAGTLAYHRNNSSVPNWFSGGLLY